MKDYEANRLIDEYLGKDDEGVIKNPKKQVKLK